MKACISLSVSALATRCCKVVTSRSQVWRIVVGERVTAGEHARTRPRTDNKAWTVSPVQKAMTGASLTRDVVKMARDGAGQRRLEVRVVASHGFFECGLMVVHSAQVSSLALTVERAGLGLIFLIAPRPAA